MSPEQRKRLEELLGRLVKELPDGDADEVVTELIKSLHENVRRFAWLQVMSVPEEVRNKEEFLGYMAVMDTGIEAGADAMMRALLIQPPLEPQPEVPSYRRDLQVKGDQLRKTDPKAAEQYRKSMAKYGLTLPETTIEDL